MVDALTEVQHEMAHMGWRGNARHGFDRKVDAEGATIAAHGGATWIADVEEATARVKRRQLLRELERRRLEQRADP